MLPVLCLPYPEDSLERFLEIIDLAITHLSYAIWCLDSKKDIPLRRLLVGLLASFGNVEYQIRHLKQTDTRTLYPVLCALCQQYTTLQRTFD